MSSVNEMALIKHPTLYRGLAKSLPQVPDTRRSSTDGYEPVRSPREVKQARLSDALGRIKQPSLLRRMRDNAAWPAMKALESLSDATLGTSYVESYPSEWRVVGKYPPPESTRALVFGDTAARRAAYNEQVARSWQVVEWGSPHQYSQSIGATWSPRAIVLVRALLYKILGTVTEAEALTLLRDGLDKLREDSIDRRYVGPVLRANYMTDGENGNNFEIDALPIRYTVNVLRENFEFLAAHLADDTTRRRIFSVPTSAYFPKLGIVEAQEKKKTEPDHSFLPQRSGVSSCASIRRFFSREGAPWKLAAALGVAVVAVVGAVVGLVWGKSKQDCGALLPLI